MTVAVRVASVVIVTVLAATPASGQSARALLERAAAAMGGPGDMRGLASTVMSFTSLTFGLGQEETYLSPPRATLFTGTAASDYVGQRRAVTQTGVGVPLQIRLIVAQRAGLNDNGGRFTPASSAQVAQQLRFMRQYPPRLVLAALDAPAHVRRIAPRQIRGDAAPGVQFASPDDTVSIYFDPATGLPLATVMLTDDPVLGDREVVTIYTRWMPAGSVLLPRQTDMFANDRLLVHTYSTSVTVNSAADSLFTIPDSIVSRAPPPLGVTLTGLAPGVWRAEGGTHHSLVVEQPAQVVIVEAPQNAAWMNAVLDTVRSRFPRKPVGLVAMSHHHWDHSGGVRSVLARGIPVATHHRSVGFVRDIARAPKTVAPDALTRRPRAPVIHAVRDSLVIGAGSSRVVLYDLANTHAEGMLAVYVPAARLLFIVDVLSPGAGNLPAAASAEVVAMVRRRGIEVDRLVGGHGGIAPWGEVLRAAGL